MKTLNIFVEIDGKQIVAGRIRGTGPQDAVFAYHPEYIREVNRPISISLPLQESPFTADITKCFFEGLLPWILTK